MSKVESLLSITGNSLQDHTCEKLEEIFCFHSISCITDPKKSDVGLDVVTVHGDDALAVNVGATSIPIFWRPKIKLVSRLYNIKHNKTIKTFSVSKYVTWCEFAIKLFSLRGMFRWGPLYNNKHMDTLLYHVCIDLIDKMRKSI
ncbi:hypothetical protein [Aliiglaciecola lipolytica]|uniref:Uncharacterized protein n=1 Tax=Aliiglaciecola lipolytica E3 TaxID=1127673 RepID=K6X6F8_9ALTE|nr:hypothetical protein [Aliiglaciecola lipolytica]GAC16204.1 hypothetical protein GLIP_3593 [Aliiglaciecola lipolytica E3]